MDSAQDVEGEPGVLFDDTWRWDGKSWTRLDVPGPPARYSPAMGYDAARDGDRGKLADLWQWKGGVWKRLGP